jgi:endoglucanase
MKIKTYFLKPIRIFFNKASITIFLLGLFFNVPLFSQLPTAQQIASHMTIGWNLGNTLEAICGENAWGNPTTTQKLIDSVKAAGFDAVRLPCAWDCHTINGVINEAWLARVKEVVDYCINDSLYVIINIHWDGGWLENNVTTSAQEVVNEKQRNYWTQIANYFKDYDEHLLFASANEPNVDNANQMFVLLSYHQTFIDAVRATGGNNSSRTLIIQGPSTDIEKTNNLMNAMPTDSIANRLMVEVHYYTPWQFCGLTEDASWGRMFYYWGKDYHSTTDVSRNATWGEESDLDQLLELMKTRFVDNGVPVIIGEYGAVKRTLTGDSDQELHLASRLHFFNYLVKSAVNKGMITFFWDTGPHEGIFDRNTSVVVDEGVLDSIMQGAGKMNTTSVHDESNLDSPNEFLLEQNYPNPFNPNTTIGYRLPVDSNITLLVYDILGKKILEENMELMKAGNHRENINMSRFTSGIYIYRIIALGTNGRKYNSVKKMIVLR